MNPLVGGKQFWHVFAGNMTDTTTGEVTYTQLVVGAVETAGVEGSTLDYAFEGREGTLAHVATFDHEPTTAEKDALLP